MARTDRTLGDKLGPRLVALWVSSQVASRRALAPHEAKVRQAATQELIDRAGREVARLYAPFTRALLAQRSDDLHPAVKEHIERMASGAHQWESIAGHLGMAAVGSIGSVISNVMFPITGPINYADRNMRIDAQTGAAAVAAGLAPYGLGDINAGEWGYRADSFRYMYDLAQSVPDAATLTTLANRRLIPAERARYWIKRGAVPDELVAPIAALGQAVLSPPDLALAVLRGDLSRNEGQRLAAMSGVSAYDFGVLLANTGEPLGLEQLLEAYRRGFIDETRLKRGVLQSRVRDEWFDVARALRYSPVPTADAVDAALRGHIEWQQAKAIAEQNGVTPGQFSILEANAGSPPADIQLLELWRRGAIDEAQVDEGLRFGRLRDNWIGPIKALRYEPLPTADAADAWLRGHLEEGQARKLMQENGLDPKWAQVALDNAGNPLGLMQLLEALRRGFINEAQFETGFRESRYRPEWHGVALQLRYSPISTADAVEALVQGHTTYDAARQAAVENGLDPKWFDTLHQTAGEPLSRTELEQLYNRGVIGQDTVEQGLRESRLKDKYVGAALQLSTRIPEPREVITALTDGVIKRRQAEAWLGDYGYAPDAVAMLIATGEVKATGPHRELAAAQVLRLYSDRIIDQAAAVAYLEELHYSADTACVMLSLADYQVQARILDTAVTAIKHAYLSGFIDATVAAADLHAMNLPPSTSALYLKVWALELGMQRKTLTEAQIVKAHTKGLFAGALDPATPAGQAANDAEAVRRLLALGYDDTDATLLLNGA